MVVFNAGRPIRGEGKFKTGADRATPAVVARRRREHQARRREDVIAVGDDSRAALYVEQDGVPGVTDLAGKQAECIHPGPIDDSGEKQAWVRAAKIGPIALPFQTEHPRTGLPAIADLTAGDAAIGVMAAVSGDKGTGYRRCVETPTLGSPAAV